MSDRRSVKTKRIELIDQAAITTLKITTSTTGDATDITGFMTGVFVTSLIMNSTCAPVVYLDVRVDTTNWVQYATLHPDLTTTANANLLNVANMPNTIRCRMNPLTTTTWTRFSVRAEVFAK